MKIKTKNKSRPITVDTSNSLDCLYTLKKCLLWALFLPKRKGCAMEEFNFKKASVEQLKAYEKQLIAELKADENDRLILKAEVIANGGAL